jgi:hypothetical protein
LKVYGVDQQRPSNIESVVASCREETQVLKYQQELKKHPRVAKEELQEID